MYPLDSDNAAGSIGAGGRVRINVNSPMLVRLAAIERQPVVRILIALAGLAMIGAGVLWVVHQVRDNPIWPSATDMGNYLGAAHRVMEGRNPYASDMGNFHRLPYPPLFGEFIALLATVFGNRGAAFIWMTLNGLSLITAVTLIMRNFSLRVPYHWIIFFCGVLVMGRSGRSDLYHGQVNFPLLLLLLSGFMLWRARKGLLASLLWAIMCNVKPFLGVITLFFMRKRDWRTVIALVVLSAVVLLASFLPVFNQALETFLGWRQVTTYYASPAWAANPLNQSFYGFLLRLFTANEFSHAWANIPALVPIGLILIGAVAATAFWFVTRLDEVKDEGERDLLRLTAVLASLMSLGPVTEGDHLYLLLPALLISAAFAWRKLASCAVDAKWWVAAFVAWLCVFFGPLSPKQFFTHFVDRADWRFLTGPGILLSGWTCAALLAAAVLTAYAFSVERKTPLNTRAE